MSTNAKYLDETGLAYFWDKVKDHISDSISTGTSGATNKIHFVVPDQKTATPTLTATVSSITALTPGIVIALRMPFNNSYNTTLNINDLGAKPLYYASSLTTAGRFLSGTIVLLIYEETSVATGCFKAVYSYYNDTDTHYTTKLYAAANSTATSNATNATSNSSTYMVVCDDSTSRGGIKITGSGGTTVSAASGTITINSETLPEIPTYASVPNDDIDTIFSNKIYVNKTFHMTDPMYGNSYIDFNIAGPTGGSDGIIATDIVEMELRENEDVGYDGVDLRSNTNYSFLHTLYPGGDPLVTDEFDLDLQAKTNGAATYTTSDLGLRFSIRSINLNPEDEYEYVSYSTAGSSVSGCSQSRYTTWSASIAAAEEYDETLEESRYWAYIPCPEIAALAEGRSVTYYAEYVCDDTSTFDSNGHLQNPNSADAQIFALKITYKGNGKYTAAFRWICEEEPAS